jgi:GNAT superfamily N-acetyltransferase
MSTTLHIRPATHQDIPLIESFILELAEYEKLKDTVTMTASLLLKNLFGEKPFAEVILGFEDEVPVGFALFFHNYSTFTGKPGLYLEDLFVRPEFRGKGYGKKILKHLISIAKQRDCGRMEWAVLDWNEPAIEFYKNLGAKPMEDWKIFRLSF